MTSTPTNGAPRLTDPAHEALLNRHALGSLAERVHVPRFNPARLGRGIVHLGCGNFHRAHQAAATQAAIEAQGDSGLRWGIVSAAMRRPDLPRKLARQDNLYTLLERAKERTRAVVIGSLTEVIFAPEDRPGLPARIADPATAIVTLTITANGYRLEPASGELDASHEDIAHDLRQGRPGRSETPWALKSGVGILAHGLALARAAGSRPPVILSCDNLPANGTLLRKAAARFAALAGDDALAGWIEGGVQFPETMVDRIVPPPSEQDRIDAAQMLGGFHDEAALSCEPWFEWIIRDFDGPRPQWEQAGARFVPDVTPFEVVKLRMLNGTHMLLAYAGALAGFATIAEAASDPVIGAIAARFMRDEQGAQIPFSDEDRDRYARELMARFRNPSIQHGMGRIGRNGSVKMATRIIEPMRENLEAGRPVRGAELVIACWIRWFALHAQDDLDVTLHDPRVDTLAAICSDKRDDYAAQVEAFLSMEEIFGPAMPGKEHILREVTALLARLDREDAGAVFADFLKRPVSP